MITAFTDQLKNEFSIQLNHQQKKAVEHQKGPALILAGPGSGKTTVLICRAACLIKEWGVNPSNILSVTYNKAAAIEMEERFNKTFSHSLSTNIKFSTIHSCAYNIFLSYGRNKGIEYTLIEGNNSGPDKKIILKNLYREINGEIINDDRLETLISNISYINNSMEENLGEFKSDIKNFSKIYSTYSTYKNKNNLIDFDDMLVKTFHILSTNQQLLTFYQQKYKYIQVDEGQDNSKVQTEIIKLLAKPQNNLFIVADDDQSIYGFRAAQPKYLLEFKEDYPDGLIYYLENNYRSTKNIVDISSKFIKANTNRFDKGHRTLNPEGPNPEIIHLRDDKTQLMYLLDKVEEIKNKEGTYKETAILFRNNLSSLALGDFFARKAITYYMKEANISFLSHWCISDLMAFLYHAQNPYDGESFQRIYYKMNRYISKTMVEYAASINTRDTFIEKIARFPGLQSFQRERLRETRMEFAILAGLKGEEALSFILEAFEYNKYAQDFCKKFGYSYKYVKELIANLKLITQGCETVADIISRISEIEQVLTQSRFNKNKDAITLSTIHSAKGLEFKHVFVIDLIEDIIPSPSSVEAADEGNMVELEEERRLFYVAITRAKKHLYLISYGLKNTEGVLRSSFVTELIRCIYGDVEQELGEGSILYHKAFGKGVVISIDSTDQKKGKTIIAKFDKGTKQLDLDICVSNGLISFEK